MTNPSAAQTVWEEEMTPYEQGYQRMMKLAGLEKQAVRLTDLRKATKALQERVPVVRRNIVNEGFPVPKLTAQRVREGLPKTHGEGPLTVTRLSPEHEVSFVRQRINDALEWVPAAQREDYLRQSVEQSRALMDPFKQRGGTTIYQGGSPAELFADHLAGGRHPELNAMRQSGPGQEAFNRWVLLHEGAEAGKHFGDRAFMSHLSTRPLLQDMNIAATLEGPGQAAVPAIKAIREPEVAELAKYVPGLERLQLGEQRLSRHAQKRLQEAYERGLDRAGVRGVPGMNA